eukprot:1150473-Pelagomonas_calceolata.AAC.1
MKIWWRNLGFTPWLIEHVSHNEQVSRPGATANWQTVIEQTEQPIYLAEGTFFPLELPMQAGTAMQLLAAISLPSLPVFFGHPATLKEIVPPHP